MRNSHSLALIILIFFLKKNLGGNFPAYFNWNEPRATHLAPPFPGYTPALAPSQSPHPGQCFLATLACLGFPCVPAPPWLPASLRPVAPHRLTSCARPSSATCLASSRCSALAPPLPLPLLGRPPRHHHRCRPTIPSSQLPRPPPDNPHYCHLRLGPIPPFPSLLGPCPKPASPCHIPSRLPLSPFSSHHHHHHAPPPSPCATAIAWLHCCHPLLQSRLWHYHTTTTSRFAILGYSDPNGPTIHPGHRLVAKRWPIIIFHG